MDTEFSSTFTNHTSFGVKRAVDILGASVGLLLFSPLIVLIALLIQIEMPGKVFYRQERLGAQGKRFWMLKFRTMQAGADAQLDPHLKANPDSLAEFKLYQKLSVDPRVTRVGRVLRRSSLDELPQLWNILKGEMSLVGPRPFLPCQLKLYGTAYRKYQTVRPGLTGLWQVSGRNCLSFQERVRLDEIYIQDWSIGLDVLILLRTPTAVFFNRGAY